MKFKELFDKEFLYESKKEDKKATKFFYKFDINIKKIDEAEANQEAPAPDPPAACSTDLPTAVSNPVPPRLPQQALRFPQRRHLPREWQGSGASAPSKEQQRTASYHRSFRARRAKFTIACLHHTPVSAKKEVTICKQKRPALQYTEDRPQTSRHILPTAQIFTILPVFHASVVA